MASPKKKGFWYFIVGDEGIATLTRAVLTVMAVAFGFFLVNYIAYQLFN